MAKVIRFWIVLFAILSRNLVHPLNLEIMAEGFSDYYIRCKPNQGSELQIVGSQENYDCVRGKVKGSPEWFWEILDKRSPLGGALIQISGGQNTRQDPGIVNNEDGGTATVLSYGLGREPVLNRLGSISFSEFKVNRGGATLRPPEAKKLTEGDLLSFWGPTDGDAGKLYLKRRLDGSLYLTLDSYEAREVQLRVVKATPRNAVLRAHRLASKQLPGKKDNKLQIKAPKARETCLGRFCSASASQAQKLASEIQGLWKSMGQKYSESKKKGLEIPPIYGLQDQGYQSEGSRIIYVPQLQGSSGRPSFADQSSILEASSQGQDGTIYQDFDNDLVESPNRPGFIRTKLRRVTEQVTNEAEPDSSTPGNPAYLRGLHPVVGNDYDDDDDASRDNQEGDNDVELDLRSSTIIEEDEAKEETPPDSPQRSSNDMESELKEKTARPLTTDREFVGPITERVDLQAPPGMVKLDHYREAPGPKMELSMGQDLFR